MSILIIDGFDDRTTVTSPGKVTSVFNTPSVTTSSPRTGSQCLTLPSNDGVRYGGLAAHATIIVGAAITTTDTAAPSTTSPLISWWGDGGTTQHVTINVKTDGAVEARRGTGSGTVLGTSAATSLFAINVWDYWEFKVTISDTVGVVEIRRNGSIVLNLTGQDTKNGGTNVSSDLVFIQDPESSFAAKVDDLYICNGDATSPNDFLGDCKVETLFPNSDGDTVQWDLSTGSSHYAVVDETGEPNTTDYAYSDVDGEIELVNLGALASTAVTVHAVQWAAYAAKSDAGARSMRRVVRTSSTNYTGSDLTLSTSYNHFRELLALNPHTTAAWTAGELNALQVGAEVRP